MLKIFFLSLFLTIFSFGQSEKDYFGQNEKNYSFLGISTSTRNINTNLGDSSWEKGVSIKYGKQSLDWRTIFALDYTQNSYFGGHMEIAKILSDSMFGTAKIRPYFAAVIGYMIYDDSNLNIPINPTSQESRLYEETNSIYYGGKFGFIIYATDTIDIDLSYHYHIVQNLEFLDDLHGATLSLHYFF